MNWIYVSTDSGEAASVVENNGDYPSKSVRASSADRVYVYEDITISQGKDLVGKIGFNPMCRISVDNLVEAGRISRKLSDLCYEVALQNGDTIERLPQKSDLLDLRTIDFFSKFAGIGLKA